MGLSRPRRALDAVLRLGNWTPARILAWAALISVSGWLVRAEVRRRDLPGGVKAFNDLVYLETSQGRLRLDVYVPSQPAPTGGWPVLVAIHGGGWRGGSKADYGRSLLRLVENGLVVVAVDYRLSAPGEPSWPDNLDDVREAVRWVRRHARDYSIDADKVAVIGASAGAHLALLLGFDPGGPATPAGVSAVIDFYGPTDLHALWRLRSSSGPPVTMMLGGPPDEVPDRYVAASPLSQVRPGAPPVLIVHGDADLLVPIAQSLALAEALEGAGVPHRLVALPGVRHGFGLQANERDLLPEILAFLEHVWAARAGRESVDPGGRALRKSRFALDRADAD